MIRNAQKLFEENRSADFQRLKSVQGIRVFNMGVVVAWHCAVSLSQTFITDVEQLEKVHSTSGLIVVKRHFFRTLSIPSSTT